jgi:hydrogenase maturation protease
MSRVLVAGIGNVFFSDDGFGVEVVHRLDPATLPETVHVADYGIRGVHLAYDLLDGGYDTLILVDAVPLGETPGTVAVLDATAAPWAGQTTTVDAHSMSPAVVLQTLHGLGGTIGRVLVLGCQPQAITEAMSLSEPVTAAVERALPRLIELAQTESALPAAEHQPQPAQAVAASPPVSHPMRTQVSAQGRSL